MQRDQIGTEDKVDSTSTDSPVRSATDAQVALDASAKFANSRELEGLTRRFLGLIRFSHTVFALPFAALACAFALSLEEQPQLTTAALALRLAGVLLCMVSARSAAMAINRLVDARFDAANPRTATRHIPAGLLSASQVWLFFGCMVLVFIAACGLFLPNWLPLAFSIPVMAWICGYSFAKRFTTAVHLWLGVALALAPICTWVALRGEIVIASPVDLLPACGLASAIALWVAGFDIIYACQDAEFDRAVGLQSIPAKLGVRGALHLAGLFHVLMLLVLGLLPFLFRQLSLGLLYGVAYVAVCGLILRQHTLVSSQDLGRVNIAFFNVNAIISFGISLMAGIDAWIR
jgi:4-hydroxybenzoate polyprenyltransferase